MSQTMTYPGSLPSYEELTRPLSPWSLKGLYWNMVAATLKFGAKHSEGLRIGFEHGFDSGVMLDYVYENEPRGKNAFGRWADKTFLNSTGWKGIRERRVLVENAIATAAKEVFDEHQRVTLADLACGGGRYTLGGVKDIPASRLSLILRDYDPANIEKAKANAKTAGIAAFCEVRNAFDDTHLSELKGTDIVVVSGLHEIISDDRLVDNHPRQIANILPTGGTYIQTIQPYHPQLEMIARALPSHTGELWAMRLRSTDHTTAQMEKCGFIVEDIHMDSFGIFGVIRARKR